MCTNSDDDARGGEIMVKTVPVILGSGGSADAREMKREGDR